MLSRPENPVILIIIRLKRCYLVQIWRYPVIFSMLSRTIIMLSRRYIDLKMWPNCPGVLLSRCYSDGNFCYSAKKNGYTGRYTDLVIRAPLLRVLSQKTIKNIFLDRMHFDIIKHHHELWLFSGTNVMRFVIRELFLLYHLILALSRTSIFFKKQELHKNTLKFEE